MWGTHGPPHPPYWYGYVGERWIVGWGVIGVATKQPDWLQNIALVRGLNKVWRKGGCVENFLAYLSND